MLKEQLLADGDHHLSLDTDTEIILHEIAKVLERVAGAIGLDRCAQTSDRQVRWCILLGLS